MGDHPENYPTRPECPAHIEDRIKRWRNEAASFETDGVIDLLCEAEEELRRMRHKVTTYDAREREIGAEHELSAVVRFVRLQARRGRFFIDMDSTGKFVRALCAHDHLKEPRRHG